MCEKKVVCVLLDDNKNYLRWNSSEPFVGFENNIAYALFSDIGHKHGLKIIFAKYSDYYNGFVKKYWFFEQKWLKSRKKIKPLLFYDKFPITKKGLLLKKNLSKKNVLFNNLKLELFCKDKLVLAKTFFDISPKTFQVKSKEDFLKTLNKIDSDKIVLKPRFGLGGKGIKICDKKDLSMGDIKDIVSKKNYLVQEFIDSSKGIPGTKIKGTHDLRCVMINGKTCFCFVRKPSKGLIASISKGANVLNIIPPKNVLPLIKQIDCFMKKFGDRLYSIDLFFSNGKYYLIELNSKPGFGVGVEFGFVEKEKYLLEQIITKIFLTHPTIKNSNKTKS